MAEQSATGFSVAGYQVLIEAPFSYRRAFVQLDGIASGNISYRGAISIEYAFAPAQNIGFTYQVNKLWGNGTCFLEIPTLAEGVASSWFVTAQWRDAGLAWTVFVDDL